jgi:hypothetical protein
MRVEIHAQGIAAIIEEVGENEPCRLAVRRCDSVGCNRSYGGCRACILNNEICKLGDCRVTLKHAHLYMVESGYVKYLAIKKAASK